MGKSEKPYTTGEIADLSYVTINAVKKWINSGKIDAFKTPGGHYRIKRNVFKGFVEKYKFHLKEDIFPEKKKILIVDNDREMLESLKNNVGAAHGRFEVETSTHGYEALIKVGSFMPHLIIMDLSMPMIDASEVLRFLREGLATRDIKILGLSRCAEEDTSTVPSPYLDHYLQKPLDMKEFKNKVEKLLR